MSCANVHCRCSYRPLHRYNLQGRRHRLPLLAQPPLRRLALRYHASDLKIMMKIVLPYEVRY